MESGVGAEGKIRETEMEKQGFLKNNQVDSFFWSDATWLEEVQVLFIHLEIDIFIHMKLQFANSV